MHRSSKTSTNELNFERTNKSTPINYFIAQHKRRYLKHP